MAITKDIKGLIPQLGQLKSDVKGMSEYVKKKVVPRIGRDEKLNKYMEELSDVLKNSESGTMDKTYEVGIEKLKKLSEEAIEADSIESKKLLKEVKALRDVFSKNLKTDKEKEDLGNALGNIESVIKNNTSIIKRVGRHGINTGKGILGNLPDLAGMVTAIFGSPVMGLVTAWTMKKIGGIFKKTPAEGNLAKEYLSEIKETVEKISESTDQDSGFSKIEKMEVGSLLVKEQQKPQEFNEEEQNIFKEMEDALRPVVERIDESNTILTNQLPTAEEKADAAHEREEFLKAMKFMRSWENKVGSMKNPEKPVGMGGMVLSDILGDTIGPMIGSMLGSVLGAGGMMGILKTVMFGAIKRIPLVLMIGVMVKGLFSGITDAFEKYKQGGNVGEIAAAFITGFSDGILGIFGTNTDQLYGAIEPYLSPLIDGVAKWVGWNIEGLKAGFELMFAPFDMMYDTMVLWYDTVTGIFSDIGDRFNSIMEDMSFDNVVEQVIGVFTDIGDRFIGFFTSIKDMVMSKIDSIVDKFYQFIETDEETAERKAKEASEKAKAETAAAMEPVFAGEGVAPPTMANQTETSGARTRGGARRATIEKVSGGSASGGAGGSPSQAYSGTISGMSKEQTEAYVANVAKTESAGNYEATNSFGFSGRYQFGADALSDAGLINREKLDAAKKMYGSEWYSSGAHKAFLEDQSNWNIEGGQQGFLMDKDLQDKTFIDYTNRNIQGGMRSGAISAASDAGDIAAYAKAAHLKGVGGANKLFLEGQSSTDAYGTSTDDYANQARNAVLEVGSSPKEQTASSMERGQERNTELKESSMKPSAASTNIAKTNVVNNKTTNKIDGRKSSTNDDWTVRRLLTPSFV